jgi:hypothetical protein
VGQHDQRGDEVTQRCSAGKAQHDDDLYSATHIGVKGRGVVDNAVVPDGHVASFPPGQVSSNSTLFLSRSTRLQRHVASEEYQL